MVRGGAVLYTLVGRDACSAPGVASFELADADRSRPIVTGNVQHIFLSSKAGRQPHQST